MKPKERFGLRVLRLHCVVQVLHSSRCVPAGSGIRSSLLLVWGEKRRAPERNAGARVVVIEVGCLLPFGSSHRHLIQYLLRCWSGVHAGEPFAGLFTKPSRDVTDTRGANAQRAIAPVPTRLAPAARWPNTRQPICRTREAMDAVEPSTAAFAELEVLIADGGGTIADAVGPHAATRAASAAASRRIAR